MLVLGWGLDGSAWGTVIAQAGMGGAFAAVLLRAPADRRRPDPERIRSLVSIGAALLALVIVVPRAFIGAGDTRWLAGAMVASAAVFTPLVLAAYRLDWGIVGVWTELDTLMVARLASLAPRFLGRRWALVGAT